MRVLKTYTKKAYIYFVKFYFEQSTEYASQHQHFFEDIFYPGKYL